MRGTERLYNVLYLVCHGSGSKDRTAGVLCRGTDGMGTDGIGTGMVGVEE